MHTQQYQCTKCGYHTPVKGIDGFQLHDELYGDEYADWSAICTCYKCKTLFHRKNVAGKPQNYCRFCGSKKITIHDDLHPIVCPACGRDTLVADPLTISEYATFEEMAEEDPATFNEMLREEIDRYYLSLSFEEFCALCVEGYDIDPVCYAYFDRRLESFSMEELLKLHEMIKNSYRSNISIHIIAKTEKLDARLELVEQYQNGEFLTTDIREKAKEEFLSDLLLMAKAEDLEDRLQMSDSLRRHIDHIEDDPDYYDGVGDVDGPESIEDYIEIFKRGSITLVALIDKLEYECMEYGYFDSDVISYWMVRAAIEGVDINSLLGMSEFSDLNEAEDYLLDSTWRGFYDYTRCPESIAWLNKKVKKGNVKAMAIRACAYGEDDKEQAFKLLKLASRKGYKLAGSTLNAHFSSDE